MHHTYLSGFQSSQDMRKNFAEKMPTVPTKVTCAINHLYDFSRFKDAIYILYIVSNAFASFGVDIPFIFLYDFSVDKGVDENDAKWLGSIIGIASTVGRVLCGVVADRRWVNKLFVYSIALTVMGTATALCTLSSSYSSLVVFSSVFGLFHGELAVSSHFNSKRFCKQKYLKHIPTESNKNVIFS